MHIVTSPAYARSRAFLFAAACVAVAGLIRAAADPWLGRSVPYLMYYPAVMIAAWWGGFWPGVFATALSAGAAAYAYVLSIEAPGGAIALLLFTINCIVVARFGEYMRRAAVDRQKLASIVESSDDAIVSKNLDGVITSWNRSAEHLWGYTAVEAIGKSIRLIIPEELWDEERLVMDRIRAGRRAEPFESRRVRKGGATVHVSLSISAKAEDMSTGRSTERHMAAIRLTSLTAGPTTVKSSRSLLPILP